MKHIFFSIFIVFFIGACASQSTSPVHSTDQAKTIQPYMAFDPPRFATTVLKTPLQQKNVTFSPVQTQVRKDEILTVIASENDHLKVVTSENITGWLSSNEIEFVNIDFDRSTPNIAKHQTNKKISNEKYKTDIKRYTHKQKEQNDIKSSEQKDRQAYNNRTRKFSDIEILSWNWSFEGNYYVKASGYIKNVSGKKLDYVQAAVTWFTEDGKYITHNSNYIEFVNLLNGQESPFVVIVNANPMMKRANLKFHIRGMQLRSFQPK